MAIYIPGETRCGLCQRPLSESEEPFATSDGSPGGEFASYADSIFHWDCVARWPLREAFARAIFESEREAASSNEFWVVVFEDDDAFVRVNDDAEVSRADVWLAQSGSALGVAIRDWTAWLRGEGPPAPVHALEAAALEQVRPRLADALPNSAALWVAAKQAKGA